MRYFLILQFLLILSWSQCQQNTVCTTEFYHQVLENMLSKTSKNDIYNRDYLVYIEGIKREDYFEIISHKGDLPEEVKEDMEHVLYLVSDSLNVSNIQYIFAYRYDAKDNHNPIVGPFRDSIEAFKRKYNIDSNVCDDLILHTTVRN